MLWFRHQLYLLGLFLLGAAIPMGGILLLLISGLLMFSSITGLVLGAFLLSNGIYGLVVSFKSFPRPEGKRLDPSAVPELRARLDEWAAAWKGPRRVEVVLDPGFWGIDLVGVPTLGLLGWPRFTWLLGLNPMMALSEREFEALASWELIWWCDQQGWLNLQVKRLATYWNRLNNRLQEPVGVKGALKDRWSRAFLRPYARFAKRRYEAFLLTELLRTDAVVAGHYGSGVWTRALCRLALLKPLLDSRVFDRWNRDLKAGRPLPEHPIEVLTAFLARWPEGADALLQLALDGCVPEAPPLLRLRLDHLGEVPAVPLPSTKRAMGLLDGSSVLSNLESEWIERLHVLTLEARRSREVRELRYQELQASMAEAFPQHGDAREYLELALDGSDGQPGGRAHPQEQLRLAEAYREANPGTDARLFCLQATLQARLQATVPAGGHVASRNLDAEITSEIQAILAGNPFAESRIHGLLEGAARQGGFGGHPGEGTEIQPEAEAEWILARRCEVLEERARQERRSVGLRDELEPHGLEASGLGVSVGEDGVAATSTTPEPSSLERLVAVLKGHARVREAFLMRKRVECFPELPVFLLVVRWKMPFWDPRGRKRAAFQALLARQCPFPPGATAFILVTASAHLRRFRRKLKALDAEIYRR